MEALSDTLASPPFVQRIMPWRESHAGMLEILWNRAAFTLMFRIVNALALTTYWNPDEFWQGPEVAHRLAFGYGYLYVLQKACAIGPTATLFADPGSGCQMLNCGHGRTHYSTPLQ